MKSKSLYLATVALCVLACQGEQNIYDASGTFEAVETIVSAETTGTIREFNIEEGKSVRSGERIGYIDTVQLFLKKKQLLAQAKAVLSKKPNVTKQLSALYEQLEHTRREQERIGRMLKADAATQKQYDDAGSQVAVIQRQIDAQQSTLAITTTNLTEETAPLMAQVEQLDDQLQKSIIVNEVEGTVLTKYVEPFEVATVGKPLYKVADLHQMTLRAYITGSQLSQLKVGEKVSVWIDDKDSKRREFSGVVEWISDKAEFTPKTIQTKDERANLVYAVKVRVDNDGAIKIGMYGDLKF